VTSALVQLVLYVVFTLEFETRSWEFFFFSRELGLGSCGSIVSVLVLVLVLVLVHYNRLLASSGSSTGTCSNQWWEMTNDVTNLT
jgi:hypothetical protein